LLDPVDQQNPMVSFLKEDRMLRIKKKYWGLWWTTNNVGSP
jgi:hypothetical protein